MILLACSFLLFAAGLLVTFGSLYYGYGSMLGLARLFAPDGEGNIPAMYSVFTLLFSSVLLLILALAHKEDTFIHRSWAFLSLSFFFLAVDEGASLHENVYILKRLLNLNEDFHLPWVIPYGIVVIILFLVYIRFMRLLPRQTCRLFIVAGLLYVIGAIGFEIPEGRMLELHGYDNLTLHLLCAIEELFEMLGIAVFIYALLRHIQFEMISISVSTRKVTSGRSLD